MIIPLAYGIVDENYPPSIIRRVEIPNKHSSADVKILPVPETTSSRIIGPTAIDQEFHINKESLRCNEGAALVRRKKSAPTN
ncbi:hypothetical protein Trydic_g13363 [Trypoxylus dichotomus]